MDDVYIVEIASTGSKGVPADTVAEVAVCTMFSDGSDFETLFDGRVSLDPLDLGKEALDFLSSTYGIEPESLYLGNPEDEVVRGFQDVVFGHDCTSFDVNHTFGKFLCFEPWNCTGELSLLPSYKVRLPRSDVDVPDGGMPLAYAYSRICPDDPANVGNGRHAVDLAQMSASIMTVLRRNGLF